MGQITYEIVNGSPPFVASLTPAVVPSQTHFAVGIYSFDNVPDGYYILTIIDHNNCRYTTPVIVNEGVNCELDGIIEVVDCSLDGVAIYISGDRQQCVRPNGLHVEILFAGYEVIIPYSAVDTTVSEEAACTGMNYYYDEQGENLILTTVSAMTADIALGNSVFANDGTTDCTYVPDGWYSTNESYFYGYVFHVESGVITAISNCTTTTTTTLVL